MQKITIVMGISCSGKSTYINKYYSDREKFDIFEYQTKQALHTLEDVFKYHEDCQNDFINAIKEGKDVILEHTLLKKIRRTVYLNAIREITDVPVELVFMNPTKETHIERLKLRGFDDGEEFLEDYYEGIEFPTEDEGFKLIEVRE